MAKRLAGKQRGEFQMVEAGSLRRDDHVYVETNDIIPADGEVVDGVASEPARMCEESATEARGRSQTAAHLVTEPGLGYRLRTGYAWAPDRI